MNSGVRSGLMRVGGTARTSDLNVSGTTPAASAVAGIFEKIDEKIEYAYGRRDFFAEDRRYWDGYIDGLEAAKRVIKKLEVIE